MRAPDLPYPFALKQESCYHARQLLGPLQADGRGSQAKQFCRKGCDLNSADGCFSLGFAYRLGEGVARNEALGTSLMDKGCAMGSRGCKFLRDKGLLPPPAAAPAPARAAARPAARTVPAAAKNPMGDPETSCRTNPDKKAAASACLSIGYARDVDMGSGGSPVEALRYYDRACTLGNVPSGCSAAGLLYTLAKVGAKGFPPQPNDVKAFGYNRRACDLDPGKCWYLADHYWKGEGVALNLATAEALYRRSCKASPKNSKTTALPGFSTRPA
ncbi:MAG: SEL1-like repeat protein [Sphingomonadales bacterium]|nr:SEL1-like repeat protein [Sphingomonadales bacterium]